MSTNIQKIVPHLWFDKEAIDAVNYYVSIFPNSRIINITTINAPQTPTGTCDIVTFELSGNTFIAMNAGPIFKFNEAISFIINCDTQEEIDYYWDKLKAGGLEQECGWLKDKFGLSWQILPSDMQSMMGTKDKEKLDQLTNEVLKMVKINLDKLRQVNI